VSIGGVCLGESNNDAIEYRKIIDIFGDTFSSGINRLQVSMGSQLVVSQLNGVYRV
jgi:hypothetical protein